MKQLSTASLFFPVFEHILYTQEKADACSSSVPLALRFPLHYHLTVVTAVIIKAMDWSV